MKAARTKSTLDSSGAPLYRTGMFKMPDITGGVVDIWNYLKIDRPHRIPLMMLSIVLPVVLLYLFLFYLVERPEPKPDIIYFENWTLDRSDDESRCDWIKRAQARNERNAKVRHNYQVLADSLGIAYDSEQADEATEETRNVDLGGLDCSKVEDTSMPSALDPAK